MGDIGASVSNEPVVAALPTPISIEPRVAPAGEAAEIARQADEAKVAPAKAAEPVKAAPSAKEEKKPLSIKESLAKAREKIEATPAAAKPISVAAKDAEPAKVEPVADKSAPDRGADGKFTAKIAEPASKTDALVVKADEATGKADSSSVKSAASVVEPAKPSHTAEAPPTRFSAAAKERWAEAPEEVRAEVTRAVTELTKGFEKHRSAAERDAGLAEFHEMAAKGGTDVKTALSKYVEMEQTLRNPTTREKGIEAIFKNVGISPDEWAAARLNRTPDQARSQSDATIRELTARLDKAEAALTGIHAEKTQAKTDTTTEAVAKFAADPAHSRFEELADDIAFFLKTRFPGDLAKAYEAADRLNPAPAPAPAATTTAASSAPAAAITKPTLVASAPSSDAGTRSIAGTPTAGSDPVRKQPSSSIKEALRRAAAAAG